MIKLFFLFFVILQVRANPNLLGANPPVFVPDFSAQALPVFQGDLVTPLCANPADISSCINQWTQQAIPLSVQQQLGPMQYQYFLPAFLPSQVSLEDPRMNENWERFSIGREGGVERTRSRRGRSSNRRDRESKKQDEDKKDVSKTTKERGGMDQEQKDKTATKEGEVAQEQEDETATKEGEVAQEQKDKTVATEEEVVQGQEPAMEKGETAIYINKKNPERVVRLHIKENGETEATEGKIAYIPSKNLEIEENKTPGTSNSARVTQNTIALASTTDKTKGGCVVIDKVESKTEGGFCFECFKEPILNMLAKAGIIDELNEKMKEVNTSSSHKQSNQLAGDNKNNQTKICSPEVPLKLIIKNFRNTCSAYKGSFEDFVKKTSCESCKKRGVAPEIMLAMMSIESAGKCEAVGTVNPNERSAGLFQVDSEQHKCLNNKKGTSANLQCLKNPINNLNTGVDILARHYAEVNPKRCGAESSKCELKTPCKSWSQMESKERDSWRRAVSAYNGGSGWVIRALYSVKNLDRTLKDNTDYLQWTHNFINKSDCRKVPRQWRGKCKAVLDFRNSKENAVNWDVDWEVLRVYYFLERLSPRNTKGTGREMKWTESNLAHTEAILGREVKGSLGIVEIWEEYIRKNKLKCPN